MACGSRTIKYLLLLFNVLWAILGILVILFGGFGWNGMPQVYGVGFLTLGFVMIAISFFGCIGTMRESAHLLWMYAGFLFVLLILLVTYMFVSQPDVFKNHALNGIEEQWRKEQEQPGAMDAKQSTYECCGRKSYHDYYNIGRDDVPASCCKAGKCINPLNFFIKGCLDKVEEAFVDEPVVMMYVERGLLGYDVLLLILALMLAIHFRNRKRRFNY